MLWDIGDYANNYFEDLFYPRSVAPQINERGPITLLHLQVESGRVTAGRLMFFSQLQRNR